MSEIPANNHRQRPLAGSPPDFEAIDRAEAAHNEGLEHIPVEGFPELVVSVHAIARNINDARVRVGAPPMSIDTSMVRLIDPKHWHTLKADPNALEAGAFYDPLSGNTYQTFDREQHKDSEMEKIMTIYTVAHELAHKATDNLPDYSFNLCEGLADLLAQNALENGALASVVDTEELDRNRRRYLNEVGPLIIHGDEYTAPDIYVIRGEPSRGITRISQLRLIEALRIKMGNDLYDTFLRSAFTSDIDFIKHILAERFGPALAQEFNDTSGRINARVLTKRILEAE